MSRHSAAQASRPPRVLIHGINYAPEMIGVGRYTGQIAEGLAAAGMQVEVVTAPPHYPGWSVPRPFSARAYRTSLENGVRVTRCPIFVNGKASGLNRLLPPVSFAVAAGPVAFWRILRWRPDVVLCVEPTLLSAPLAMAAARLVRARTVLHVQDLEVDAAFAVGHLKAPRVQRLVYAVERWMLRRFDGVITISGRMASRLEDKGVERSRIEIVRNWTDVDAIRPLAEPNGFRSELGFEADAFVVLYAGQIGAKQGLHLLFEAARHLVEQARIQIVVAGDGPLKAGFVEAHAGAPNVHFLPLQPEERLCELLNLADLHVLPQERHAADLVLPSKLAGMLASGRPVLVTADRGTELHDVLQGTALLVPPGDPKALAGAIRAAASGLLPTPGRGRALAQQLFSKTENMARFAAVLLGRQTAGSTKILVADEVGVRAPGGVT